MSLFYLLQYILQFIKYNHIFKQDFILSLLKRINKYFVDTFLYIRRVLYD